MLDDYGERPDSSNIPVNCALYSPKVNDSGKWEWIADTYMPRKDRVSVGTFEVVADTREEIMDWIVKWVKIGRAHV